MLPAEIGRGELSGDGEKILYSSQDGFILYDVASGSKTVLNLGGYNPKLSTNGPNWRTWKGRQRGLTSTICRRAPTARFPARLTPPWWDGHADDSKLYVAVMAAGGSAWQIQSIECRPVQRKITSSSRMVPTKRSTRHSPRMVNGSHTAAGATQVYIIARIDGSETRLLLDNPSIGTSGITWAANGWLGVSILQDETTQKVILVNPATCEVWLLPQLNGTTAGVGDRIKYMSSYSCEAPADLCKMGR